MNFYTSILTRTFEEEERSFLANLDFLATIGASHINVSRQNYFIQSKMDTPILTVGHKHVVDDADPRYVFLCYDISHFIFVDKGPLTMLKNMWTG